MKFISYLRVAFATTFNIILNALTLGRYVWLEGRVRNGVFKNWAMRFRYKPKRFVQPTSEEEIVELVKNSKCLRIFGSAHSFNGGVVVDDTLVSLDKYSGVVWKDLEKKQLAVKGGTRVRDVVKALLDEKLAFAAQPSHDAQSIAGILSTDVHGTGKNWGFVSESVVRLKLIDGKGEIIECEPSDDLFKAAIGGIGAAGIIAEVVVQGVDRFNVEQKTQITNLAFVKENLDRRLQENDHFSLYLFPFTDKCQINTWNRTIYHLHQELEFAVPFEDTFDYCRDFIRLYEENYNLGLPYTLFEVRFTPAGHDRTLSGAGRAPLCPNTATS